MPFCCIWIQWNCNLLTNWLTLTVRRECLCLGVIKAFFCRYTLVQNTFEVECMYQIARFPNLTFSSFVFRSLSLSLSSRDLYCSCFNFLLILTCTEIVCSRSHIKQIYKQFADGFFFLCYCINIFFLLFSKKCWCHLICHWFWSWFHTLNNSTNQFRVECTCETIVSLSLTLFAFEASTRVAVTCLAKHTRKKRWT